MMFLSILGVLCAFGGFCLTKKQKVWYTSLYSGGQIMVENKYEKLKTFITYCKSIEKKQKLYQFFGRAYVFDLKEFTSLYNYVSNRSLYVAAIDKVRLNADDYYRRIKDFQHKVLANPVKNMSDCKKLFGISYTFKDEFFDENKLNWYVVKQDDQVRIIPVVYMVSLANQTEEYMNLQKPGYLPSTYDFIQDKYYKMGDGSLNESAIMHKQKEDITKAYVTEEKDQVEYFENLNNLQQAYPQIKEIDISAIVPPYEDDNNPYWDKDQIIAYAEACEDVINKKEEAKKTIKSTACIQA